MILEIINVLGIVCTIYGSIIGQQQNVHAKRLNQAYLMGCICFLIFFGSQGLWWNVGLYIILGILALKGIWNHRYKKLHNFDMTDEEFKESMEIYESE